MGVPLPWRLKLHAKLALSRLGLPYGFWSRLGLFRHGYMDQAGYALRVFEEHQREAAPAPGFRALELGPGDSLASALIARAHGAKGIWMVDHGDFAHRDVARYRELADLLREKGLEVPEGWRSVPEMLEACGAAYLTEGLASLRSLPPASVDLIWSHAVLEHVRRRDFLPTLQEFRRLLTPSGVMTHQIDLQDHLGGALNSLRFPEATWESPRWVAGGFYTNRLRQAEILDLFAQAGFQADVLRTRRWEALPTPRHAMVLPYRDHAEEDLQVKDVFLRCRPREEARR